MAAWEHPVALAIVGAEKAGTTALFRHLGQSPQLVAHAQREMTCFVNAEAWATGEVAAQRQYFPGAGSTPRLMKDVMLMSFPEALERLRASSPQVKVVVMLREPAERAWSAYNYARSRGIESAATFAEALALESERMATDKWAHRANLYVYNSTYADKVRLLHEQFGHDNVLVIYQSEYRAEPEQWLQRIGALLGITLFPAAPPELAAHNRAAQARSQTVARLLAKWFRSRGPLRKALRTVVPSTWTTALRQGLLGLNRTERDNAPLPTAEARQIRESLKADAAALHKLVGRCPWAGSS